jgi:ATP-dependent Clp protease ATP-binding subunit ClpA
MEVLWETLDVTVDVTEYTQKGVQDLVYDKRFSNQQAYEQYIVSSSVINIDEIISTVQAYARQRKSEGIPADLDDLHHELFLLVCSINPLLKFKIAGIDDKIVIEKGLRQKDTSESYVCPAACPPEQEKRLADVDGDYILSLATRMNQCVVGQEDAVQMLSDSIITAFAGIKEPNIPIGNYIFIGNTGIGKTYTAQSLNDVMIGIRKSFHRFDMSEFAEGHEYTKLIGAPSGYRGYERGGLLTNAVAAWPFCVILADEIEEAHEKTRKIFLVVMDEGHLKDGQGNEVFFGESTLIMTSNIGARNVEAYAKRTGFRAPGQPDVLARAKEDTLRKAVEDFFPAKFLNRVDDVIYFRDLEWEEYLTIAELELNKTTSLISSGKDIAVTPSPEIITWIRDNGCNISYGARPLKRFIKKHFRLPLARLLLDPESGIGKGDKLIADLFKGKLHFEKE